MKMTMKTALANDTKHLMTAHKILAKNK
jgi:hypothetical protein